MNKSHFIANRVSIQLDQIRLAMNATLSPGLIAWAYWFFHVDAHELNEKAIQYHAT